MTAARLAISLDAELARRIRASAHGQSISAWLADAAAAKLRHENLREAVAAFEAESGAISLAEKRALEDEIARAPRAGVLRRRSKTRKSRPRMKG